MKNKLKVYRAMHDLTQESLAKKLQVTRSTIVSLENGKYYPATWKQNNPQFSTTEDNLISGMTDASYIYYNDILF
jgi:transcriptional regulator with XRE-family HTH domain